MISCSSPQMTQVLSRLKDVTTSGSGWTARCPGHDDNRNSLSASLGDDGKVLLHCHAGCQFGDIVVAIGMKPADLMPDRPAMRQAPRKAAAKPATPAVNTNNAVSARMPSNERIVETYDYCVKFETLVYQVVRLDPKGFRQRRPDGNGGWIWNLDGVQSIPFRFDLLTRADAETSIFICEGEKDVLRLEALGLLATCNSGGASKWKFPDKYLEVFRGREAIVLVDNDPPGEQHGQMVAASLFGIASDVRVVLLPGLPLKGDVSDWLDAGGTLDELQEIVEHSPSWDPTAAKPSTVETSVFSPMEDEDDPHRLARLLLSERYPPIDGQSTLVFWRDEFHAWDRGAWTTRPHSEVRSEMTGAIKAEFDRLSISAQENAEPGQVPRKARKVTRPVTENAMAALQSLIVLPARTQQPAWLGENVTGLPAEEFICTQSGLLHLPSVGSGRNCLYPLTPRYFTPTALDYPYDPSAACHPWLQFLDSIWSADQESIQTLQEVIGYLLSTDISLHKLFMLIGPPRSGKGTIGRVLKGLIGANNLAAPTLGSLGEQFGLSSLVGKSLAMFADARLTGRADSVAVVERLLSITGEDPQDIQRKHMATLTGVRLPVRFVLMTNELPNLKDAAGAIQSRVVMLKMPRSFLGKEDRSLDKRLQAELPGILNWSIQGWQRLKQRGEFLQPASANELLEDLENLASPIGQFLREQCEAGPERSVSVGKLYEKWKSWCEESGRDHPGTQQTFGRDLTAAMPHVSKKRTNSGGARERHYQGIGLRREGPQWSADNPIACDAKSQTQVNREWEVDSRSCNGEGRGPSRTKSDDEPELPYDPELLGDF